MIRITLVSLAFLVVSIGLAEAQGVSRGAREGAAIGERKAGKPGKVVGVVVGGIAGGVVGGVKGVLGIPQNTRTKVVRRSHRRVVTRP